MRSRPRALHRPALAVLLVASLVLRLWGIKQGLPYSYNLDEVPTLAPVALALYGCAGVLRRGRTRDYLLAGLGVGLAAATKYTGGITIGCIAAACACDAAADTFASAARKSALALVVAMLA